MTKEKKEEKKTAAKKAPRVQADTKAKAPVLQEDVYPAINIANIFGLSDFAFYMIKEAKGINDGTLITMSEFEKYIKEVIRR